MSDITIRRGRAEDLDALVDVFVDVTAEDRYLSTELPVDRNDRRRRWLGQLSLNDHAMFVACDAGRPIAQIVVYQHTEYGPMFGMMVSAKYRGGGIGTRLLEEAIDWARAQGFPKLSLLVFAHNARALALYKKFGFVEIGYYPVDVVRRSGEAWDTVLMSRSLERTLDAASFPRNP